MTVFEVGKFYRFGANDMSSKRIPALCTKVMKRKAFFQYIARNRFGKFVKRTDSGWLLDNGKEQMAHVGNMYSLVQNTFATDVCDKPKDWDKFEEEEKEG